ncbi:hypothetical protein SDC9_82548 [bioreactor metagenome]|uniref:LysM domain-containing protein n=1 Tax=bioreactor metagenome TaxID=1076179 RepID=A0A644ZDI6_9ZZZZ|nr:G5 domain-containing protein [Candidatus Metalachnospira sp.]
MDEKRRKSSSSRQQRRHTSSHTQLSGSEIDSQDNMSRRKKERLRKQMHYDKYRRVMFIGITVAVIAIACIIGFATRRNGSEVFVNGESVGIVQTRKITDADVIKSVTAMLAEQSGTNVQIMDEITVKGVHVTSKVTPLTTETLLAKLRDSVAYNIESYAIAVNGNVVVTLKNQDEAKQVLDYVNKKYTPEGVENATTTYAEDVQVVSQYVSSDSIMSVEDAKTKITMGESVTETHEIASGETLSSIASKYSMKLQQLYDLNGLSSKSKIFAGEKLTVQSNKPIITVKTTVTSTENITTPKEIEYQYDNTKSSSYKKIIQKGTDGVSQVTKEKVYVNGVFQSENTVSTKTVTEAAKEVVCIGTK